MRRSIVGAPGYPAGGSQGDFFDGQPRSFHLPRAVEGRIGVVDVGSNSVRMVIFEGGRRCPAMVFNEKIMCGLGAELALTGRLSPQGRERALRALLRFVTIAPGLGVRALAGVATAALREAADGREFRDLIARETGIRLRIASGEDEARLSAQGVIFGDPDARGLVVDLGGASMEFCPVGAPGGDGGPGEGATSPLGPQRLGSVPDDPQGARARADALIAPLAARFGGMAERLYLVGGSWRTLGRVQIHRSGHPLHLLHEYRISSGEARALAHWIRGADAATLRAIRGVPSERVPALPAAALLLEVLLDHFAPEGLVLSGFGLREGVCYEYLPDHIRQQDPLLSTCAGHERTRARAPGFGAELADWVLAAMAPQTNGGEARLVRAACHLADVTWRALPDNRAPACVEVAMRINMSGAGHEGRAFIAAMLMARYRGPNAFGDTPMLRLLDAPARRRAARFGVLMRLGCVLAGVTPGFLPHCPLVLNDDALRLSPAPRVAALMGEEVDKRLARAARLFGLRPLVTPC